MPTLRPKLGELFDLLFVIFERLAGHSHEHDAGRGEDFPRCLPMLVIPWAWELLGCVRTIAGRKPGAELSSTRAFAGVRPPQCEVSVRRAAAVGDPVVEGCELLHRGFLLFRRRDEDLLLVVGVPLGVRGAVSDPHLATTMHEYSASSQWMEDWARL